METVNAVILGAMVAKWWQTENRHVPDSYFEL